VTAHEAAKLPLRKEPAREGQLRIIDIKDYDLSACGGTHVQRTGAIGVIAIAGVERFKGGLRVEFVCGGRVLRAYRSLKSAVGGSVRLLSVLPDELPSAIEKLQVAGRSQQKSQEGLYERLAAHEAAGLAASAENIGGVNVVAASVSGWDANGLKKLASSIAAKPASIALLLTTESPMLVVAARSQDLSLDTGGLLKKLIEQFGGRGGGKGALAQGGGLTGDLRTILDAARAEIAKTLTG
jgi:alanyl-tRNA synthetase